MRDDRQRREIREKIEELTERLRELGGETAEETEKDWEKYRDSMREKTKEMWQKAKNGGQKADQFVRENPWKSVGIAFVVGFLAGMISGKEK